MPELTPEQKEHLKMARRASERISETWNLFTMYLSQDKRPTEALELARAAVEVWAEWQDNNEVEPSEIDQPDFGDDIRDLIRRANPSATMVTERGAIFEPAAEPNSKPTDQDFKDMAAYVNKD